MGVNTTLDGDTLTLDATVLSRDGKQSVIGASRIRSFLPCSRRGIGHEVWR